MTLICDRVLGILPTIHQSINANCRNLVTLMEYYNNNNSTLAKYLFCAPLFCCSFLYGGKPNESFVMWFQSKQASIMIVQRNWLLVTQQIKIKIIIIVSKIFHHCCGFQWMALPLIQYFAWTGWQTERWIDKGIASETCLPIHLINVITFITQPTTGMASVAIDSLMWRQCDV